MMGKSSPGPLAYAPVLEAESLKRTAPRAVFSAADRERQVSLLHAMKGGGSCKAATMVYSLCNTHCNCSVCMYDLY